MNAGQRHALRWLKQHGGIVNTNTPDFVIYDLLTQAIDTGHVILRGVKDRMKGRYHTLALTRRGWQVAKRG